MPEGYSECHGGERRKRDGNGSERKLNHVKYSDKEMEVFVDCEIENVFC
jgi:hypothetical protein